MEDISMWFDRIEKAHKDKLMREFEEFSQNQG